MNMSKRPTSSQPLIEPGEDAAGSTTSDDDGDSSTPSVTMAPSRSPEATHSTLVPPPEYDHSTARKHSSPPPKKRPFVNLMPEIPRSDSVGFWKPANGSAVRAGDTDTDKAVPPRSGHRVPSLKLKRMSTHSQRQIGAERYDTAMPCLPSCVGGKENPSITITIDSDDDSIYSDYICPEINYKTEPKVQFIGDSASLYGTPKEDLTSSQGAGNMDKSSPTGFLREQFYSLFQPSDNKLAMKLFGNKNALLKEKMRHKRVGNFIIHPCSDFR